MSTRIRRIGAALMLTALLSAATLATTTTAHAQSPCVVQRVVNGTGCPFTLCLYDAFGVVQCYAIAAGPAVVTNIALGPFVPIGTQDFFGNQYPFVAPPIPGCTPCYNLNPAAINCCGFVCYDQANCIFRVVQCVPPC